MTDYETLLENIHGLKAGKPVQVPIYDFKSSSRVGYRSVLILLIFISVVSLFTFPENTAFLFHGAKDCFFFFLSCSLEFTEEKIFVVQGGGVSWGVSLWWVSPYS